MRAITDFHERVEKAFEPGPRGILGLVDDLLSLGSEQGLSLNWHDGQCRIRMLGAEPQEANEIPVRKSVFRALLARVAVLCNERTPNSVSPYGGEGELAFGNGSPSVVRVVFVNHPGEQRLTISRC